MFITACIKCATHVFYTFVFVCFLLYWIYPVFQVLLSVQSLISHKRTDVCCSKRFRGGSRAAATSKMECFVIIVNRFQPLTIIKALHLGCCSGPRSASAILVQPSVVEISKCFFKKLVNMAYNEASRMKLNKDELVRVTLVYQDKFNGLYLWIWSTWAKVRLF